MQSLIKEIQIPGLTPQRALSALRGARPTYTPCFLLESATPDNKQGQYSYLGINPFHTYQSSGENPLPALKKLIHKFWPKSKSSLSTINDPKKTTDLKTYRPKDLQTQKNLPFTSGPVGYFSYEMLHHLESVPHAKLNDLNMADAYFLFFDTVIVFDHSNTKTYISLTRCSNKAEAEMKAALLIDQLSSEILGDQKTIAAEQSLVSLTPNMSRKHFEDIVKKSKDYIRDGDTYQVNLSQRFSTSFTLDPFELYQALAAINPSPFGGFIDFGDMQIVSSSPERLLQLAGRQVQTRPIAGTSTPDKQHELRLSEKDRAEHIMLVDLERNDLGRICEYGTVRVNELMTCEHYSHVSHIVSNIKGILQEGKNWSDVVTACFPGGTITGTPKVRTMEIISELEPTARGAYTGSMGFIDYRGGMDLNIIIRSLIIQDQKAHFQVGAGIVADSDPGAEYEETLHKGQALRLALEKCYGLSS
ncbi:anthranilate synthase component I family protein [Candidatus Margulisiibacteriota bacterium]